MTYVNFEVLTNAMATNVIDFSNADIYELRNSEMTEAELEQFLSLHNEYTTTSWLHRYYQINLVQQALEQVSKMGKKEGKVMKNVKKT